MPGSRLTRRSSPAIERLGLGMMQVTETLHGRYLIKSGYLRGQWTVRAFLAKVRQPGGIVAEKRDVSETAAIAALVAHLDDKDHERRLAGRVVEGGLRLPGEAEFAEALRSVALSDAQIRMLKAHARAGDRGLTAGELAHAGGYADYSTANMIYGRAGRVVGDALGIAAPPAETREGDVPTALLASAGPRRANGYFVWVMHVELRRAVERVLGA